MRLLPGCTPYLYTVARLRTSAKLPVIVSKLYVLCLQAKSQHQFNRNLLSGLHLLATLAALEAAPLRSLHFLILHTFQESTTIHTMSRLTTMLSLSMSVIMISLLCWFGSRRIRCLLLLDNASLVKVHYVLAIIKLVCFEDGLA